MNGSNARLRDLYRYPVKGLSPERLSGTILTCGETIPGDRLYAIENGPSGFAPSFPSHLPKQRFLMLMRNARLARLKTRFEDAGHQLSISLDGRESIRANLRTAAGRGAIEAFLADFCAEELRGAPRVLHAEGHSFSDVARKVVSIINLASVAELEHAIGAAIDPLRFRANLYVEGWPPWQEFRVMGRTIAVGPSARLRIVKRIVRCAATEVDPQTGERNLAIPRTLAQAFGHGDCGVYADVVAGGGIASGDAVELR
jgi:uncharacterized protein